MVIINTKELAEYNPFYFDENGNKAWSHCPGDKYHVTGTNTNNKRFKLVYDKWIHAAGINLYKGSKWLVRGGKRFLIQRVYN